jgi:hypothetical protein
MFGWIAMGCFCTGGLFLGQMARLGSVDTFAKLLDHFNTGPGNALFPLAIVGAIGAILLWQRASTAAAPCHARPLSSPESAPPP